MTPVVYKYCAANEAEPYLEQIEMPDFRLSFRLSSVSNFADLKTVINNFGAELSLAVIEIRGKKDLDSALRFVKWLNSAVNNVGEDLRIGTLVLFLAEQPDTVADSFEREGAICMVRKDPNAVVERLRALRRFLRRIYVKAQIRIVVTRENKVRVWILGMSGEEHEFVLSPQLLLLVFCLGTYRYADKYVVAKCVGIGPKSVKVYMQRLRDAYDRFNAEEPHLRINSRDIFQTLHYADQDLYRLKATVIMCKEQAA